MPHTPDVLYHATTRCIPDGMLEPHIDRHGRIPQLFAQPDKQVALAYALKNEHMRTAGRLCGYPLAVFNDREQVLAEFTKKQQEGTPAGYIYELAPATFKNLTSPDGAPGQEWVSEQAVKAQNTIAVHSLDDVMKEGVQVFFLPPQITKEQFRERWQNFQTAEEGLRWLKSLETNGLLIHENTRRNIRPEPLPQLNMYQEIVSAVTSRSGAHL